MNIPELNSSPLSFLVNAPRALTNSFLRPHLFESRSPFILLAAIENFILLILALTCVFFFQKDSEKTMVYFCLSFVFILFLLIGWITPVLGALVRYKVPALPLLAIALLMMTNWKKVFSKFPFLEKILN